MGEKLIFAAGILFCLIAITTALLGGLFARYVSTGAGSDSARVAKFGDLTLTETGDFVDDAGMIIPGNNLNKAAVVHFSGSEMATVVFVEVIFPQNTWETTDNEQFAYGGLSWSIDSDWDCLTSDLYEGNHRYVYYQILDPHATLEDEIISGSQIIVSEEITKDTIDGLGNAKLTFQASVIQSGGFNTLMDAWAAADTK